MYSEADRDINEGRRFRIEKVVFAVRETMVVVESAKVLRSGDLLELLLNTLGNGCERVRVLAAGL